MNHTFDDNTIRVKAEEIYRRKLFSGQHNLANDKEYCWRKAVDELIEEYERSARKEN